MPGPAARPGVNRVPGGELRYSKTDIKAVRRDSQRGGGLFEKEYRLPAGVHLLQFLPAIKGNLTFYFRYYTHYLNRQTIICPQWTWNERCPVCAVGDRLFRSTDPEESGQGRKLWRRECYVCNALNLQNKGVDGVQPVTFGVTLRDELAQLFVDQEEAEVGGLDPLDITDPVDGAWVRITVTSDGADKKRTKYHAAVVKTHAKVSYAKWQYELHDFKALVRGLTLPLEELRKLVLGAADEEENPLGEEEITDEELRRSLGGEEFNEEQALADAEVGVLETDEEELNLEELGLGPEPEPQLKPQPKSAAKAGPVRTTTPTGTRR